MPVPLGAVAMTIGLRSLAGSNRFEISLDPKDLGRIDVNLDIDKDNGTVTAHLTVDRPETLALLQRDVATCNRPCHRRVSTRVRSASICPCAATPAPPGATAPSGMAGAAVTAVPATAAPTWKEQRLPNDAVPLRMLRGSRRSRHPNLRTLP